MRKSKLYRKVFNFLIKVTISILLLVVINNYLFGKDALLQSINAYKEADSTSHPVYMIILIGLMPLNWFLEMLKWRSVLQTQKRITLSESFYAVMSGVTLGVITPARVGEYVGRSLYVDKNDKHLTYIGTLLCSISQNLINITLGLLACSVYISTFNVSFNLNLLVLINSLIVVLGLAIYFNVFKVIDFLKRYTFFRKLFLNSSVIEVSNKVLLKILLWASLRYGIYLLQFILALKFLGLGNSIVEYFASIGTIFLIQSSVPIPPIFDLFARGELAVLIFTPLGFNMAQILLASTILWVINLIFPALLGWFLMMRLNLLKSVGYGKV